MIKRADCRANRMVGRDSRKLLASLRHKLEAAMARLARMKEDAMRRSSSCMYDRHIPANDHMCHRHQMHSLFQDHCGMMLLETSSYGPSTGNLSLGGAPSFGACYNALMVQPASPAPELAPVTLGDLILTKMMQGFFTGDSPISLLSLSF
ncbi:hypothetical protein ACJRO7_007743 [Eucalyptus globulus]|uniref:Uncharacterized protein n=1 Tax=Eucalyptus globulus TaxID=34317 RepID=A0ABD3IMQ6_EUCGL